MTQIALRTVGLGKRYRIGVAEERATSLREALVLAAAAPMRNLRRLRSLTSFGADDAPDVLWALRDVSLEVKHGEVLGVIGRNGAGKSTLLKILSRITSPSAGFAEVRGRVGSLLEVGTGFHPELTGRDNVYLNGAILGMDRGQIDRKFEEIVEFSGVERFIDTPVKRYSSGMYLRLAFAVAAHLEPDVLIVDEVLAVGDAEFQKKCLGRMDQVARDGRTVLFVSHNVGAMQRLCSRAVFLDRGRLVTDGTPTDVLRPYLASGAPEALPRQWIDLTSMARTGSGEPRFTAIQYGGPDGEIDHRVYPGGPVDITLMVVATTDHPRETIGFTVRDPYGSKLLSGSTAALGAGSFVPEGTSAWRVHIPSLPLRPATYELDLWLGGPSDIHDRVRSALRLEVFDRQTRAWGPRFDPRYDGPVYFEYQVTPLMDEPVAEPQHARGPAVRQ
jgi:lipopolysaccharide transport system ATP-binding protein